MNLFTALSNGLQSVRNRGIMFGACRKKRYFAARTAARTAAKEKTMASITIDEAICKGCGLCVNACPKRVIALSEHRMNSKGYFVAEKVNPQNCIGCAFCAIMCPDCAITVEK